MSNFNPGLNPTSDPDYERSARPLNLTNAEAHNKEADNQSLEGLFRTAKAGLGMLDKSIQEGAKDELQQGYERLNGAQGVDLAAGNAVVNPGNTVLNPLGDDKPPTTEQNFIADGMKRLTIARDQGKLSNSHYYAQLEAMVREVKSRYPGYSEIIDKQIEGIAGVKPANALRQSLLHDMDKADAAKAEKLDWKEKFVIQHADFMTQAEREEYRKGNLSIDDAIAKIEDHKGDVQELQAKTSKLNALAAQNKLYEDTAKKGASEVTMDLHRMALTDVQTLAEQAQKAIAAGTFDPSVYGQLLEKKRLDFKQNAWSQLAKSGVYKSLDVNQVNQIIDDVGKGFDDYAKVFTKDGTGSLSLLKTQIEALKNRDMLTLYKDPKVGTPLRAISAAQAAGGPEVAKMLANRFDQMDQLGIGIGNALNPSNGRNAVMDHGRRASPVAKSLLFDQSTYMGLGDPVKGDPVQFLKNMVQTGQANPMTMTMAINTWKQNLTDSRFGPDFAKNSAAVLFSEKNRNFLTEAFKDFDSRKRAYGALTSPEVTQAMSKFKRTPEYENYKEWAYNGFLTIMKGSVNRLQNVAERPYLDLKMNEETGHLELIPNKQGEEVAKQKWYNQSVPFNAATILENLLGKGLQSDVRDLNMAIDNVRPILEGDKYRTPDQLKQLMGALAKTAPEDKKGLWQWIAKSVQLPDKNPDDLDFGGKHPNFTQASGSDEGPGSFEPSLNPKKMKELNLTDQEKFFYKWHVDNLTGPGGVDNKDGSRSTVYASIFNIDGKERIIPSIWDGKHHTEEEAVKHAKEVGIDKFPTYDTPEDAMKREKEIHDFMEKDVQSYKRPKGGLVSLVDTYGPQTASQAIMDMIAKGESGSNYNRLVDTPTHPKEAPLTDMSIREVLNYQKGMLKAGNASSAAGKYQIVSKTLRGLVEKGVVSMDDRYDQATQDKLANALLEGRGYKDYLEGRKSLTTFMHELGSEWEIIKVNPSLARRVAEELRNQKLAYAE